MHPNFGGLIYGEMCMWYVSKYCIRSLSYMLSLHFKWLKCVAEKCSHEGNDLITCKETDQYLWWEVLPVCCKICFNIFPFSAATYEIRTSESPLELRDNFDEATVVNTSSLTPHYAGYKEIFSFKPAAFATRNTTIIYVAVCAIDKASLHSDISNIAQAVMFVPPMDFLTANNKYSVSTIILILFGLLATVCLITSVTLCVLKKRRKCLLETATKLLWLKMKVSSSYFFSMCLLESDIQK